MYHSLKSSLITWNATTSERAKLQHLYITASLVLIVMAGVIGLLNQELGQQILGVAIIAAGIFLINAIAWALLQSFILLRLDTPVAPSKLTTPRKTTTRKK